MISSLSKALTAPGMPSTVDPTHTYVFKSGEFGTLYSYWYRDQLGNYFRYTNAPPDSPDYDPTVGQPLMDPEQPLPSKNPEFFSEEGHKLSMSIPEGGTPVRNPNYNQADPRNVWYAAVEGPQYIYLDSDVKENLDLYIQYQLRVVDSALSKARAYATQLFQGTHIKDKLTGAIFILVDQGYFEVEELTNATVGDVVFVDQAVILLGRKFVCDLTFLDFMTSITASRSPDEPLFVVDTVHGKTSLGPNYLYAVFCSLRTSPKFLLSWNASHLFSRIVNRMHVEQIPAEEVEARAFAELSRVFTTRDDTRYLVDYKLRVTLLRNYEGQVSKGLQRLSADDYGIAVIRSDLTSLREDEKEFSTWLHVEPLHDTSPAEEQAIADAVEAENAPPAPEAPPGSPDDQDKNEGGPEEQPEAPPTSPTEGP